MGQFAVTENKKQPLGVKENIHSISAPCLPEKESLGNASISNKTPLTILLVEDNPSDALLFKIALQKAGPEFSYTLQGASSLKEGIEFSKREKTDVVILDLSLPDSSGIETLTYFKSALPHLPVIVFTGTEDPKIAVEGIHLGAQDYLFKGQIEPAHLISAMRYSIERQIVQNAIEQNRLEAERESDSKQTELQEVVHDLRSPLAGVIMQLQNILDGDLFQSLTPKQRKVFEQMYARCQQVLQLSNGLLDFHALSRGDVFQKELVDLAPMIQKTFESFQQLALKKGVGLKLISPSSLKPCFADGRKIAQAVSNLISNAIKFSHSNTNVLVKITETPTQLEIAVRDEGLGIPAGDLPKLFKEFSRASVRPTAGEETVGLGLAIVKKIVDAHSGKISIDSEVGRGSIFTVELPISGRPDFQI